ncbi:carboxypeptidase-like regulatory domain-containing protein [Bacteroides sp. 519]|uniref:carboxypeptidase-like regulatory domain-containing protein n=1 Tax=Bacteroides sp. 519 TaxID=2302937 RepID=UPI0013D69542|nr:carboxypeptidase-like regulatory domain-containing protein [Bacteroides sp. 519]NDV57222.1 carboxypeptidase-like regulatory domain-containing protein [Bacteroides sp. 519]
MKTIKTTGIFLLLAMLITSLPVMADGSKDKEYITINGVVRDKQNKRKLEYVNVSVLGTSIGTVTNMDGGFSIKVADDVKSRTLEISHLGYRSQKVTIGEEDIEELNIYLEANANTLPEVLVRALDAKKLVEEAVSKIAVNNSKSPNMLTGFYRETVRKRRSYINVTEAIINVYKTPYTEDVNRDRVQVFKGRQLVSPKQGDTLIVKLQGGPNYAIFLDVVKNHEILFDEQGMRDYKFTMGNPVMLDQRPHYVVNFEPQAVQPYPLFYGKLYIDEESKAFTQAEFSYNMKDRNKITHAILKRKPFNLRFKPEEITYLVTYKQEGGTTYLNYMRNEIKFKCDWKRKLFSTNYAVVNEMVVTNKKLEDVSSIPGKEAFNFKHVLSDKVGNFYDENFWEGYNIIAPTESLESAVNKLKKQF